MNKLTEQEILKYIKPRNGATGVDGITREELEAIDLDSVPEVIKAGNEGKIFGLNGEKLYKYDNFTPRANSHYFKPSFAGRQVLLGRTGRELHFSNGRWFAGFF